MNVNVIEDIARLPAELQMNAYVSIKEKEMDKKEALKYLRSVKQDAILSRASDTEVQTHSSENSDKQIYPPKDIKRNLKKIDKDVEQLSISIKAGAEIDRKTLAPILESLIGRLNALYAEVKDIGEATGVKAQ
jgi:ParB family chromosome partitioning protein